MGKNFETKKAILDSLATHKRTLTDISNQMGLSPSTIKQHLNELQMIGMVRYVEDMHLHRHKYYECVPYATLDNRFNMASEQHSRIGLARPIEVRQAYRPK